MSASGSGPDGGEQEGSDLIRLSGPLTMEAVLRQLHQNFMEGRCYVSMLNIVCVCVCTVRVCLPSGWYW